jgi:hypothetical protein
MNNTIRSLCLAVLVFISQPLLASDDVRFYANGLISLYLPTDVLSDSVISPIDNFLIDLKERGSIHIETILSSDANFNNVDMRKVHKYLTGKKTDITNDKIKSDIDAVKMLLDDKFNEKNIINEQIQDLSVTIFKNNRLSHIYITDNKIKDQMAIIYLKSKNIESLIGITLKGIESNDSK